MIITNRLGHTFPLMGKILGGIFFILGLTLIGEGPPPGVESSWKEMLVLITFLLLVGAYFLFTTEGIQIDISNKKYRRYSNFLSFKRGKWQTVTAYKSISLLSKRNSYNLNSQGRMGIQNTEMSYELYLLDEKHIRKLIIGSYTDLGSAKDNLIRFGKELDLPISKYAPQIKSRRR